jgi:hypothetical protein
VGAGKRLISASEPVQTGSRGAWGPVSRVRPPEPRRPEDVKALSARITSIRSIPTVTRGEESRNGLESESWNRTVTLMLGRCAQTRATHEIVIESTLVAVF